MSEMSTVEAVWHSVFNRGFTRDNASMVNAVVASALVLCQGFMSSRRAERRAEREQIGTPDAENSLISFEQWLLDERREYMAMIHLLQTPPYRSRAIFLQMVAVLVGHGRMALNFYNAHNCDAAYGRSIRGFSRWLRSGDDDGAHRMMLEDLLDEARLALEARHQVGEEGEQVEEGDEGDKGDRGEASDMPRVAQAPSVEQRPEGTVGFNHSSEILHHSSANLDGSPQHSTATSTGTAIYFRYEVMIHATDDGNLDTVSRTGAPGERQNSYKGPLESVRLQVTIGNEGSLTCSLTQSEDVDLRTLHERVAGRLRRNLQRV